VTTADFVVRNSRKQFLRLTLPEGSKVWSAFVDGRAEKPALSDSDEAGAEPTVLIKIIHSTRGFPVRVVYATPGPRLGGLGTVRGVLPRPDILVTESRWDVYVPDDLRYGTPRSNMELAAAGQRLSRDALEERLAGAETDTVHQALEPLRISVPSAGVLYAFEKLYANQSQRDAWMALPYAPRSGSPLATGASVLGALLLWLGLGLLLRPDARVPRRVAVGCAVAGGLGLTMAHGLYPLSPWPALLISALVMLAGASVSWRRTRTQGA